MAIGMGARSFMGPLLAVNLVMYAIVLGLAGWSIDKFIDRETHHRYLLIFSLLAGAVGACQVVLGLLHLRTWQSGSLAAAVSSALVSWAITALAFGLACKQIILGNRGRRLRTLEAFIIILTLTQLLYLVLLHAAGVARSYDTEYGFMLQETQKPAAAPPDA